MKREAGEGGRKEDMRKRAAALSGGSGSDAGVYGLYENDGDEN